MPKRSSNAKSGPSEGIQQAPTVPSVGTLAHPSEAVRALTKSGRRKLKKREAEANGTLPTASGTVPDPTGKASKRSRKKAKRAAEVADGAVSHF
jgi:hypothetical protein